MLPRLSSIHRIAIGLVSITVSAVLTAGLIGLIPDPAVEERQARQSFCESTAVSVIALASRMEMSELKTTLDTIRNRNSQVESLGVRDASGKLMLQVGDHSLWEPTRSIAAGLQNVVPIQANGNDWGQLEVRWKAPAALTLFGRTIRPELALTGFLAMTLMISFTLFLRRVLKQIDPGKVVPNRVRDALNSLAEGLLVLDPQQTIVLANESFSTATGIQPDALVGHRPDSFGFRMHSESHDEDFPWNVTARSSRPIKGVLLTCGEGDATRTYSVSTVPVKDDANRNRGVVASFEDVTQLQKKQEELRGALTSLRSSTEEIRKQNRELEWLATRDTLTGCLNRRSFFGDFEKYWQNAHDGDHPMSVAMVDIDHFKSINDNFGHGMGDEVLKKVAATVMATVSETDLVCRYGGEEFTVLMPMTAIDDAEHKAEQIRLAIKALEFPELKVTASLGVSALCQLAESPQDLLDQADKCLYVSKRNGRNQVSRWDRSQALIAKMATETAPGREEKPRKKSASAIPFQAVAALTAALAQRDQATAVHSRRVADLCVATAEGLLSLRECYVLEIAALLHDIGRIGIPDAILKKPGRLTPEEMELVHQYNRMGVDMVRGSFGAPVLTEIMEQHVVYFDMSNAERGAGPGHRPSVGARILCIANAYDTMVSRSSWRGHMSRTEAMAELRRCAGTQFDPELVERFIDAVKLQDHARVACEGQATRESALNIGLMLEQLVGALDDQDPKQLMDITNTLQISATTHGLPDIAHLCVQLHQTLEGDYDQIDVMQMAGELLDMCRSTQSILLESAEGAASAMNAPTQPMTAS
ncbi:MAG: diguanylate cyclase [Planctomycetaceae bacterium]